MKFLKKVVEDIISKDYELSNLAIVLPNRRAALFFKKYIQENNKIKKPIFAPDIFSIQDFIHEVSDKEMLSGLQQIFKLYEIYLDVFDEEKDFDEFYNWGNIVLNDFKNIDNYLVDNEKLFKNLEELTEMEEKFELQSDNEVLNNFRKLALKINELYKKYHSNLKRKNQNYYGGAIRNIAENYNSYKDKFKKWDSIIFAGFNALTKAEEVIIKKLKSEDRALLYWDIDNYFYGNKIHEAGEFFRNSALINENSNWIEDILSTDKKNIKIIGCSKKVIQAKILGNMIDPVNENNNDTAVVLPDESMLFPLLHSLPEELKHFNITMGFPLRHTSLYNLISFLVDMHENKERLETDKYYYEDVTNILTHPYMLIIAEESVIDFVNMLKKENKVFVSGEEIENNFNSDVSMFFEKHEGIDSFINYLMEIFIIIRKNLKKEKGYTIELEYLYQFYLILQKLQDQLKNYSFDITINSFWRLFKEIIDTSNIPFTGEPLQGLQIMGMLETRTLDFNNLYILSMNEGVIPKSKNDNSIIPYELKKKFGIPTYEKREGVYAYYFYRLLKRAKNVTLFYNTEKDSLGKGEKSRFLEQLLLEYREENDNVNISEDILTIESREKKKEKIEIAKSPEIISTMNDLNFSASAINTYLSCSLKFYFQYVLGLREKDDFLESVDSQKFGLIVHRSLEKLYSQYVDKPMTENNFDEILKKCENVVEKIYKDEMGDVDIKNGRNYLYSRILKELVSKVIKKEQSGVKIVATEKKYSKNIEVEGKTLRLKGIIDRIDEINDVIRVIDYKTGNIDSTVFNIDGDLKTNKLLDSLSKKKEVVQLLIYYYLIVKEPVLKNYSNLLLGILSLRNLKKGIKFFKKSRNKKMWFSKNDSKKVEKIIKKLLTDIFDENKNFIQTQDEKVCRYCDFADICAR
ncbi:MAG: hypothetical protein FXF47_01755 [Candidatus Mcinerneyibacterium aminivorans]|uniref:PD-(D/E)XK endonuclease-like domain-containing protein n=1 Tax=Candidatus Mcinerneyibacterium aminivorans TaxID=2703815 RepID=A0A5D0MK53_9BACT|nr:MAG: hypothetical protein FXF47_01755 [Candidatus Mcinerneyibacterium aminivorans]